MRLQEGHLWGSIMSGSSRLVNRKWPRWLTANCISYPSCVLISGHAIMPAICPISPRQICMHGNDMQQPDVSVGGGGITLPALLHKTSRGRAPLCACSPNALTLFRSDKSICTASIRADSSSILHRQRIRTAVLRPLLPMKRGWGSDWGGALYTVPGLLSFLQTATSQHNCMPRVGECLGSLKAHAWQRTNSVDFMLLRSPRRTVKLSHTCKRSIGLYLCSLPLRELSWWCS